MKANRRHAVVFNRPNIFGTTKWWPDSTFGQLTQRTTTRTVHRIGCWVGVRGCLYVMLEVCGWIPGWESSHRPRNVISHFTEAAIPRYSETSIIFTSASWYDPLWPYSQYWSRKNYKWQSILGYLNEVVGKMSEPDCDYIRIAKSSNSKFVVIGNIVRTMKWQNKIGRIA